MDKKFSEIFDKFCNDIYRLAYSYTHNKEDSEDIVQFVFLKYLDNINKISTDDVAIKKWLIVVTINKSKDFYKSSWKKHVTNYDSEKELDLASISDKEFIDLHNTLVSLPKKYRIVFHLYYFMGYNTNEISKLISVKESSVRQLLSRGRKLIKKRMEGYDVEF